MRALEILHTRWHGHARGLPWAGVRRLDITQRLARHPHVRLTEDLYTDFDLMTGPEHEAAELLVPEVSKYPRIYYTDPRPLGLLW